jgi:hypothetical protein
MMTSRLILIWVVSLMLFIQPGALYAKQVEPFVVKSATTHLNGSVYFLNAVLDINLPYYITSAVDQGFNLPLLMEIEFYRHKTYWFNQRVVYIKQQYVLNYLPLLDAVSVLNVNSGRRQYFSTLNEAIQHVSVFLEFPVLDKNTLIDGAMYEARLRMGIDQSALPIPLKSSSFWKNDWDLVSDWYEWELTP